MSDLISRPVNDRRKYQWQDGVGLPSTRHPAFTSLNVVRTKVLHFCILLYVLSNFSNCSEPPDCVHFPARQLIEVPFIFIDKVTGENLVSDYSQNPKEIKLDSLALLDDSLEEFPATQEQLKAYNYGVSGYILSIHVFDQSEIPNVDILTPGTVTYYLYSGNADYDTIVFDYHFQFKKYCYSPTNDTLNCFINGKPAGFPVKGRVKDAFAIEK